MVEQGLGREWMGIYGHICVKRSLRSSFGDIGAERSIGHRVSDGSAGCKVAYIESSKSILVSCRGFALSRSDQSCKHVDPGGHDDDVISRQSCMHMMDILVGDFKMHVILSASSQSSCFWGGR